MTPPSDPAAPQRDDDDEGGGGDDGDGQTQRQLSEDKCWLASSLQLALTIMYIYSVRLVRFYSNSNDDESGMQRRGNGWTTQSTNNQTTRKANDERR